MNSKISVDTIPLFSCSLSMYVLSRRHVCSDIVCRLTINSNSCSRYLIHAVMNERHIITVTILGTCGFIVFLVAIILTILLLRRRQVHSEPIHDNSLIILVNIIFV